MKLQSESPYITIGLDVMDGDTIIFCGEGEYIEDRFNPDRKKLQMPVKGKFNGEKLMTLNNTSQKSMAQAYGYDTSEWKDKEAMVQISETIVAGQKRNVMYLTVPNLNKDGHVVIQ
jgi:hypothetical protein